MKGFVIRNNKAVGMRDITRTLTATDIIRGVDVPKKLGVVGFGRQLPWRKKQGKK